MRPPAVMLAALVCASAALAAPTPSDAPFALKREGWSFDRSVLRWYDAAKREEQRKAGTLNQVNGWAEYDFETPADGWYELLLRGGVPGWPRDIFVDGEHVLRQAVSGREDMVTKGLQKEVNLRLSKGRHTLRIRRLGFPGVLPSGWELRASDGDPAGCVFARIEGPSILRRGGTLTVKVSGGTTVPTEYEIVAVNRLSPGETVVGTIRFPASAKGLTRTLSVPCATEGVFDLAARAGGKPLRPADFRGGPYAVVDTRPADLPAELRTVLVHDIDCVKQTDMGRPILKGEAFWEATEPTRVSSSPAGAYREGGENTDPGLPHPPKGPSWRKYNSGFSYAIDVPAPQETYLLEVDYPDDDRRTVNVFVVEPEKEMPCQLYGGYETGDWFELSNAMQTERIVFHARGTKVRAAILSKNPGMRAAAARIRVFRVEGGLPPGPPIRPDGRILAHFMEESTRWLQHGVPPKELTPMARDFLAIRRYVELCRHHGFSAVSPTEAIYQGMTYYSDELEGWFVQPYDAVRIVALMCEKYGMKYVPELHLSDQAWFRAEVVEKLAADPAELYNASRLGTRGGSSWFSASWNPLHPAIQEKYIRIVGELADKVADSPAFGGISLRLMTWVWQGWNALPSLNWGYSDWTVAQFSKDTGIAVPGAAGDPDRFEKRFAFLTAPEMLERWLAWRNGRMLSYHRRIRDRIRAARPDAVVYLPYFGDAESGMDLTFGSFFGTEKGALRECGLDLDVLAKEPGICVYPNGAYGRRDLGNVVADAGISDSVADPRVKELGFGYERAFGIGNAYFEDQANVRVADLGLPELPEGKGNNGAAEGAGRHVLEKLSLALADQDSGMIRQGGMGYTFGRTPEYREWLAEYLRLPKLPFAALDAARDPVAVWYRDCPDGFYFYAVNREPAPVRTSLRLSKPGAVASLSTGLPAAAPGGVLALDLKPYQLRAFRAARGASIASATTEVPPERIALVRDRLAFCQRLARDVSTGARKNDLSPAERDAFLAAVETAWEAVESRLWWRARTVLSSRPAILVFNKLAAWPEGQLHRRMGVGLLRTEQRSGTEPAAAPMLEAAELRAMLVPGNDAVLADASSYDPAWLFAKVLRTARGEISFDLPAAAPGRYRLSLGHVSAAPGAMAVSLGETPMATLAQTRTPNRPEQTVFPVVSLPGGTVRLTIRGQAPFGVYGVTLQPVYRPIPSPNWMTIGPFPTPWKTAAPGSKVREAMERTDPPMRELDFAAAYPGDRGATVRWQASDDIRGGVPHFDPAAGTSFLFRAKVQEEGVCYAATSIVSPEEREAEILVGCDWWANGWLNGKRLVSTRPADRVADDGSAFNGWRPLPARVRLTKGVNTLLIKSHGGTVANWFTCWISDPGDLAVSRSGPAR